MSTRLCLAFAISSSVLLALPTRSPAADAPTATDKPAVLQSLEREGVSGLQPFETGSDLRGYAGFAGQQPLAVYLSRDGGAIVGSRIGADGKPLDVERVKALVEKPMGEAMWSRLASSGWVQDGKIEAPRVVFMFSDPNCPYCNRFWEIARPWVAAGKVQLRHVVVGVIRADSATKAAAILEAADASAALRRNERQFAQGGIKPARNVSKPVAQKLDANQRLMTELGFRGTPGIVYRDAQGIVRRASGMPPDDALAAILGPR